MAEEFNNYAKEFLTKMQNTFPDEPKVVQYNFMFDSIRLISSNKPVEMFMENLSPYGVQIMSKDEKYFKDDQYVNHVESMSGKMGLTDHWDELSTETKNSIWEYMQTLYVLGMGALNKKNELRDVLTRVHGL